MIVKHIFEDNKKAKIVFLKSKGGRFNPKFRGGLTIGAL